MPQIESAPSPVVIADRRQTLVRVLNPFLFESEFGRTQVYFNRTMDSFVKALSLTEEERLLVTKLQVRQHLAPEDVVHALQGESTQGVFVNLYDKLQSHGVDVPSTKPGIKKRMRVMTQVVTQSAARRSPLEISNRLGIPLSSLQEEVKPLLRRVLVEAYGQWRPTHKRIRVLGETEDENETYDRIRENVLYRAVYSKALED